MQFEYFRGDEAEQFMFYRVPQTLVTDERFRKVSSDAKLLYGLLLDRIGLSFQNPDRFVDEFGRTFIYFTRETTMKLLNCGKEKAAAIFQELEKVGLIERKRQGLGKPTKIYVKNFAAENTDKDSMPKREKNHVENCKPDVQRSEKPTSASPETLTSRGRESRLPEVGNTDTNTYQIQGMTVKYYEIIDRLNAVNQEDSLLNWFTSFGSEWQKILAGNTITYEKAYMKSCIWNWLNEYKFSEDNTMRQLDYELKMRDFQAAI